MTIHIDSIPDVIRVINVGLCLGALVLMAVEWRHFFRVPRGRMFLRAGLGALVIATLIGTIEALILHVPADGIRTYGFMLALGWITVGIILERQDRKDS